MADIKKLIDEQNIVGLQAIQNHLLAGECIKVAHPTELGKFKDYTVFQYAALHNKVNVLEEFFATKVDGSTRFGTQFWYETSEDDVDPKKMSAIELAISSGNLAVFDLFLQTSFSPFVKRPQEDGAAPAPVAFQPAPPRAADMEPLFKLINFADCIRLGEKNGQYEQISRCYEQLKALKEQLLEKFPLAYVELLIAQGDFPAVSFLQAKGLLVADDLKKTMNNNNTYLHMAAYNDSFSAIHMVEYLVEQGLDPNAINQFGDTPLHAAMRAKNIQIVAYLSKITRVNCPNQHGFYPLHLAVLDGGFPQGVDAIIANGGDINAVTQNEDKNTALHLLAEQLKPPISGEEFKKNYALMARLIRLGANPSLRNAADKTCFEIIEQLGPDVATEVAKLKTLYTEVTSREARPVNTQKKHAVFKGGSVKGIAYVGALEQAEKKGLLSISELTKVGGTSAGAITALFLGLGYSLEEIRRKTTEMDMLSFLDYHDAQARVKLFDWYKNGVGTVDLAWNRAIVYKLWEQIQRGYGACEGDKFLEWIRDVIKAKLQGTTLDGKPNPDAVTFADLHNARDANGHCPFKEMAFVGVNISKGGIPEVFSYDTTPDMCVADAIRISMSLPLVFKPWQKYIKNDKGERVLASTDLYVDGGIIWNYPLGIFDDDKFHVNPHTLGFCLVDPMEYLELAKGHGATSTEIKDILTFLGFVVGALFRGQDYHQTREGDRERTIYINTDKYGMLDFGLADLDKENLIQYGRQGVDDYLERSKHSTDIKLSAELCRLLIECAALEQHNHKEAIRFTIRRKPLSVFDIYDIYSIATDEEIHYLRGFINPNVVDEYGNSALHVAMSLGDQHTIDRLLKANANPYTVNGEQVLYDKLTQEQCTPIREQYQQRPLRTDKKIQALEAQVRTLQSQIEQSSAAVVKLQEIISLRDNDWGLSKAAAEKKSQAQTATAAKLAQVQAKLAKTQAAYASVNDELTTAKKDHVAYGMAFKERYDQVKTQLDTLTEVMLEAMGKDAASDRTIFSLFEALHQKMGLPAEELASISEMCFPKASRDIMSARKTPAFVAAKEGLKKYRGTLLEKADSVALNKAAAIYEFLKALKKDTRTGATTILSQIHQKYPEMYSATFGNSMVKKLCEQVSQAEEAEIRLLQGAQLAH